MRTRPTISEVRKRLHSLECRQRLAKGFVRLYAKTHDKRLGDAQRAVDRNRREIHSLNDLLYYMKLSKHLYRLVGLKL